MKVADLMTVDVKTCQQTDTLEVAVRLMRDFEIRAVPVVDPLGRLVGIVTDRDACMAAYEQRQPLHWVPCAVAMSVPVITCRVNDEDTEVAEEMAEHKIRHVPVVDDAQLPIGMVSLDDLVLAVARGRGLLASDLAATLAAICEHRPSPHVDG